MSRTASVSFEIPPEVLDRVEAFRDDRGLSLGEALAHLVVLGLDVAQEDDERWWPNPREERELRQAAAEGRAP